MACLNLFENGVFPKPLPSLDDIADPVALSYLLVKAKGSKQSSGSAIWFLRYSFQGGSSEETDSTSMTIIANRVAKELKGQGGERNQIRQLAVETGLLDDGSVRLLKKRKDISLKTSLLIAGHLSDAGARDAMPELVLSEASVRKMCRRMHGPHVANAFVQAPEHFRSLVLIDLSVLAKSDATDEELAEKLAPLAELGDERLHSLFEKTQRGSGGRLVNLLIAGGHTAVGIELANRLYDVSALALVRPEFRDRNSGGFDLLEQTLGHWLTSDLTRKPPLTHKDERPYAAAQLGVVNQLTFRRGGPTNLSEAVSLAAVALLDTMQAEPEVAAHVAASGADSGLLWHMLLTALSVSGNIEAGASLLTWLRVNLIDSTVTLGSIYEQKAVKWFGAPACLNSLQTPSQALNEDRLST